MFHNKVNPIQTVKHTSKREKKLILQVDCYKIIIQTFESRSLIILKCNLQVM